MLHCLQNCDKDIMGMVESMLWKQNATFKLCFASVYIIQEFQSCKILPSHKLEDLDLFLYLLEHEFKLTT